MALKQLGSLTVSLILGRLWDENLLRGALLDAIILHTVLDGTTALYEMGGVVLPVMRAK